MDVFVVIYEDRHVDTDIEVFSDLPTARLAAQEYLSDFPTDDIEEIQITDAMAKDGWEFCTHYSCEGDSVRILRRPLEGMLDYAKNHAKS